MHNNPEVGATGGAHKRLILIVLACSCLTLLSASPRSAVTGIAGKVVYVGTNGALNQFDPTSGKSAQLLTGAGRTIHNPVWSPDGTRIAFLAAPTIQQPGRLDDIYIISADGTGQRRVSAQGTPLHDLSWFPDNRRLLFATGFNGGFQTHVLRLDDGSVMDFPSSTDPTATFGEQLNPVVSPDGANVASLQTQTFADNTRQQGIAISDGEGQNGWLLVDFGSDVTHFLSSPSWSPEGGVAYGNEGTLEEASLDGSPPVVILSTGTDIKSPIAYATDGSRLAASAVRAYDRTSTITLPIWGLLLGDRDGSNTQLLDVGTRGFVANIEWAGANVVLFSTTDTNPGGQSTLFAVQRDGTNMTRLVGLGEFGDFDWHS